jgi:hypothetical protein
MVVDGELRRAVSESRFATYLAEANGDESLAWALYEWNLDLSAAFHGPLAVVEIALRNRLYEAAVSSYGANWLTSDRLRSLDRDRVRDAVHSIVRRNPTLTTTSVSPEAIVAELTLAFWVSMVSNRYDQTLWRESFGRAIRPTRRRAFHDDLDRLRTLRNRIAHHERLLNRNPLADERRIATVLNLISPTVAAWVANRTQVGAVAARRPVDLRSG